MKFFKEEEGESQPFVSQLLSGVSFVNKVQNAQAALTNWKSFAIFFSIGLCLLVVSLTFLPMIILFPAKFGALFSLGSLCMLISLSIIKGAQQFCQMFFKKDKFYYTFIYLITLGVTLYFSLIEQNYLFVLSFSFAQLIALAWLFAAQFPGGITGMKLITSQVWNLVKTIFSLIFGSKQKQSFLPL